MSHRYLTAMFGLVAVVALTPILAAAQSPEVPRTPWGAPDLQGSGTVMRTTSLDSDNVAHPSFSRSAS